MSAAADWSSKRTCWRRSIPGGCLVPCLTSSAPSPCRRRVRYGAIRRWWSRRTNPAARRRARSHISPRTTKGCWPGGRSSISPIQRADIERPSAGVSGAAALEAVADVAIGRDGAGEAIEVALQQQLVLLALAAGEIVRTAGERACWRERTVRRHRCDAISNRLAKRRVARRIERRCRGRTQGLAAGKSQGGRHQQDCGDDRKAHGGSLSLPERNDI